MPTDGPLAGLTILDLTRVLSGPQCTMVLADMGARVIKIEQPGRGDETRTWGPPFVSGESAYFLSVNRNKESVTLDFKHDEGRRVFERLVARADVLVENFRPGTLDRLGLGYAQVAAARPDLIYCSISGFGQTGPRSREAGYDAVIQAEGGLMSVTGNPDGPPCRVGVAVADIVAGLLAAQGVLLALYARTRTGRGQHVDISMLDAVVSLLSYHASMFLTTQTSSRRVGNRHATIAPYDTMPASDGDFFLAVGNDVQFRRLCDVVGLEPLPMDPRFSTNPARVVHYEALREQMVRVLKTRPRADWIAQLKAAGVPCGDVRDVPDVFADPQVIARQMVEVVDHLTAGPLKLVGIPVKLSDTPGRVRMPPPTLGQHTERVLGELDLSPEAIADLRARRVI